jgi:hypothetical protein
MDLQMSITRNGECVVSSRQPLGEWDEREDREKMVGKGKRRRQKCRNPCHGDLEVYINKSGGIRRKV